MARLAQLMIDLQLKTATKRMSFRKDQLKSPFAFFPKKQKTASSLTS